LVIKSIVRCGDHPGLAHLPTEGALVLVPLRFTGINALGVSGAPGQQVDVPLEET